MQHNSVKHKELSKQLANWWQKQTDFRTKKALASFLKVHPDTVGDYFSGRKFPRSDIANRLYEVTNVGSLKTQVDSASSSDSVSKQSSARSMQQHPTDTAASRTESPQSARTRPSNPIKEGPGLGSISEKGRIQKTGAPALTRDRYGGRSVVISLQRTICPFCGHDITRFRRCVYCGQDFVWANVLPESVRTP